MRLCELRSGKFEAVDRSEDEAGANNPAARTRNRAMLVTRAADFNIILDDVAITHLSFGKEYTAAVEAKLYRRQLKAAMAAAVATSSPPKDKGGTTARVIPFRRSSSAPAQAWSRALTPRLETLGEA